MPKIVYNKLDLNFFWERVLIFFFSYFLSHKWELFKLFKISYPFRERRINMFVY